MSITTYNNLTLSRNGFLTYHEKLKNELEKIPKLHKKFFMESLAKHKFDMDIYIPNRGNVYSRKIYPDKDYLLNKIVKHDDRMSKQKKKIGEISKDFTKFYRFFNYLKNNNIKQRDYMGNLISIYHSKKEKKGYEYSRSENIFNNSVLLDGEKNDFRKYENQDGKSILLNDNKILINLERAIQKTRSPNSMVNKKDRYKTNFITSMNESYFINRNNEIENDNDRLKSGMKTTKTEGDLTIKDSSLDKKLNIKKSKKKIKTGDDKSNNALDQYIINSNIMKISRNSRNKNYSNMISNKRDIKGLTIQKTINDINGIQQKIDPYHKISKLRNIFFKKYNTKTINNLNDNNKNEDENFDSNVNKDNNNNVTILNKVNIKEDKTNDISDINREKTILNSENQCDRIRTISKTNKLKIKLPGIKLRKDLLDHNISLKKIVENPKTKKQKSKTNIKKEKMSNKYSKEREINRLYSTLSTKSNFFREYPEDKIKTYFKKYKNMTIKKIELEKGSNIYPILDNLENLVKDHDTPKLAKSLEETKKYLIMKNNNTNNVDLTEEKSVAKLDKINENEQKFPLIKYDCAERIIFGEEDIKKV